MEQFNYCQAMETYSWKASSCAQGYRTLLYKLVLTTERKSLFWNRLKYKNSLKEIKRVVTLFLTSLYSLFWIQNCFTFTYVSAFLSIFDVLLIDPPPFFAIGALSKLLLKCFISAVSRGECCKVENTQQISNHHKTKQSWPNFDKPAPPNTKDARSSSDTETYKL